MNNLSLELQLINEYNILNSQYDWVCGQLVKEQEKYKKLKDHHEISINLILQLNSTLIEKSDEINKLLINLYEEIDESYTEKLEGDDELAIVRAETQLELIIRIINEVERI